MYSVAWTLALCVPAKTRSVCSRTVDQRLQKLGVLEEDKSSVMGFAGRANESVKHDRGLQRGFMDFSEALHSHLQSIAVLKILSVTSLSVVYSSLQKPLNSLPVVLSTSKSFKPPCSS